MKNKLISVIVPVYNVEDYLDDCLSSLINQSYSNLEIVLVNDGSTDHSYSICLRWSNTESRIKLMTQENLGLSAARNTGIRAALGEYICFVDSDDIVHRDYLSKLYSAIESTGSDIAVSRFSRFSEKSSIDLRKLNSDSIELFSNNGKSPLLLNKKIANTEVWNKMYKSSLIDKMQSPVFPAGKIHEDEYFTPKILELAKKAVFVDHELYFYRSRPNSITSSLSYRDLDGLDFIFSRLHLIYRKYPSFYLFEATNFIGVLPAYIRALSQSLKQQEKKQASSRIRKQFSNLPEKRKIFLKGSLNDRLKIIYLFIKLNITTKI